MPEGHHSKHVFSYLVPSKGTAHPYPIKALSRDVKALGYRKTIMKSDHELSIVDVDAFIAQHSCKATAFVREAPVATRTRGASSRRPSGKQVGRASDTEHRVPNGDAERRARILLRHRGRAERSPGANVADRVRGCAHQPVRGRQGRLQSILEEPGKGLRTGASCRSSTRTSTTRRSDEEGLRNLSRALNMACSWASMRGPSGTWARAWASSRRGRNVKKRRPPSQRWDRVGLQGSG